MHCIYCDETEISSTFKHLNSRKTRRNNVAIFFRGEGGEQDYVTEMYNVVFSMALQVFQNKYCTFSKRIIFKI
jgi:hypothetical protein